MRRWWRHSPPHRHKFGPAISVADHRGCLVRKHTRHRWQVAYIAVDDAEQRDDGGLVGGDAVEVAHRARLQAACSGTNRYSESTYFGGDGIAEE